MSKKIFKYFWVASLCFFCLLAIGYLTPRKWGNYAQTDCAIPIYIANQGIHTAIVLPVKNELFNWTQYLRLSEIGREANSEYKYLSFGWGDRAFMLETATSATINPVTTFNALFLPTLSLVHVQGYLVFPRNKETKCVKISGANYLKIVNFIKSSFQLDAGGNKIKIGYGYHNSDSFYEANGSYSIWKNCNDWTAEALRKAEVNTPLWSTLSSAILFHLNSGCECT